MKKSGKLSLLLVLALALSLGLAGSVWAQPMGRGMGHRPGDDESDPGAGGEDFRPQGKDACRHGRPAQADDGQTCGTGGLVEGGEARSERHPGQTERGERPERPDAGEDGPPSGWKPRRLPPTSRAWAWAWVRAWVWATAAAWVPAVWAWVLVAWAWAPAWRRRHRLSPPRRRLPPSKASLTTSKLKGRPGLQQKTGRGRLFGPGLQFFRGIISSLTPAAAMAGWLRSFPLARSWRSSTSR